VSVQQTFGGFDVRAILARWYGCGVRCACDVDTTSPCAAPLYRHRHCGDLDCYNVGSPALSNNGQAAFIANCPTPFDSRVVRKGDGQTTTDVYVWSTSSGAYSVPDSLVSINDFGVVAFGGGPTGGGSTGYTILFGDGGPLTVVADTSIQTQWAFVARPSINNAQLVAFMAASGGSYDTVIRADAGTLSTIAQPGTAAPGAGPILQAFEPALNNAGQVEFFVNTVQGVPGIFRGSGGR
jgi:hypothetical protein